jgi:glycosyltransferase involved in cell wall biosynthesis
MTTIHFIYPHGKNISAPDAIGRIVGRRLMERYKVFQYNWDDPGIIKPGLNDVLLGHPHPFSRTIFRRSLSQSGWRRMIAMSPYSHGDIRLCAFLDSFIKKCDLYLAIAGNYWFSSIEVSPFAHWRPKMTQLDLAVDRADYPNIKTKFNVAGQRRFLYIGLKAPVKNTGYLSEIAKSASDIQISWAGSGGSIEGVAPLGYQDFSTDRGKQIIAAHDFMITVGKSDANPTTILESMAWGLIPVCTPQSGYIDNRGIINIPLGDAQAAIGVLRQLQEMPEVELKELQQGNWNALDAHFHWERFTRQIIDAIESNSSPKLGDETPMRRAQLRWASLLSPWSPARPRKLIGYLISQYKKYNGAKFA